MAYPANIAFSFGSLTSGLTSQLDQNFTNLAVGLNGIGNGSSVLSSVAITTASITTANVTTISFNNGTSTTAAVPLGGKLLMTRVAGNWVVYTPNGTTLSTPGTQTQGLQEAISYAANNSFSLVVDGGGGNSSIPALVSNSNIFCTGSIKIPPMTGQLIDIRACSILFSANVTGNGITFDSCDMVHFRHTGQIIYTANSSVVYFAPTNANSEAFTGITTSKFEFGAIVSAVSSTYAPDPTKGICAQLDSTNGIIINSTFSIDECNGGQTGLAVNATTNNIQNNVFLLPSVHTQGAQGINVGYSGGLNTGIHGNHFDAMINTGNSTTSMVVFGVGNTFDLNISGNSASIGVNLQSSASGNLLNVSENLAITKVSDNSTAKDNQGYGAGWTQSSSLATNGYYKFPTGLIIQWGNNLVNGNSSMTVSLPLAFPNASLSATVSQEGGKTVNLVAPGYSNLSTTTINLNNNHPTSQFISFFVTGY